MVKIEDTYFMIFNWIDGKILNPNEITIEHCKTIGTILAQIHNIDFSSIGDEKRKQTEINDFNWSTYLKLAQENNKKYTDLLEKNIDMLYRISQKSIKGIKKAKECDLIVANNSLPFCNKDSFNTMWNEIKKNIVKNGYFVGNFFGLNDSWKDLKKQMTFLGKEQILSLFDDFEIISLKENESDEKTGLGEMKHWHRFFVIAKKL